MGPEGSREAGLGGTNGGPEPSGEYHWKGLPVGDGDLQVLAQLVTWGGGPGGGDAESCLIHLLESSPGCFLAPGQPLQYYISAEGYPVPPGPPCCRCVGDALAQSIVQRALISGCRFLPPGRISRSVRIWMR